MTRPGAGLGSTLAILALLTRGRDGGRLFAFGAVGELTGILETLLVDEVERARLQGFRLRVCSADDLARGRAGLHPTGSARAGRNSGARGPDRSGAHPARVINDNYFCRQK